jgi:hypothetical protein
MTFNQGEYSPTEIDDQSFKLVLNIELLFKNSSDIIAQFDSNLRVLYINPIIEKITGIPRDNMINKTTLELDLPEEFTSVWNHALESVFKVGEEVDGDFSYPTLEGLRWYSTRMIPEFEENNIVQSVISISHDITPLKQSLEELTVKGDELEERVNARTKELSRVNAKLEEEIEEEKRKTDALKISEEKYRNLINIMEEGVWVINPIGNTTFVNPQMEKILGYSESEMEDQTIFTFAAENNYPLLKDYLQNKSKEKAEQFEFQFV